MEMWRHTTLRVCGRGSNCLCFLMGHCCCHPFGHCLRVCSVHKLEHRIPLLQSEENQLALDVRRMDSGQGHLIHRHPFHCQQTVVGQWHLAVCNPQAFRTVLCAAVVSQCLSRVLSQLCPLHVKLRNTSAVSNVMSTCLIFMTHIRDFMSEKYNFMSDTYNFV